MNLGARRIIGVGFVLGVADMANNDFSATSVGWFAADTIMTGVFALIMCFFYGRIVSKRLLIDLRD